MYMKSDMHMYIYIYPYFNSSLHSEGMTMDSGETKDLVLFGENLFLLDLSTPNRSSTDSRPRHHQCLLSWKPCTT